MEKRFENKLIMLRALVRLLRQNETAWSDSPPLVKAIMALEELILQIEQTQLITTATNSGLVVEKQNQKKLLIDCFFELASMLFALSQSNNDQVLRAKTDFPISELRHLRDGELAVKCRNILNLCQIQSEALIEYGTTPDRLTKLESQLTLYEQHLPVSRVTVLERKAANEKLKALLASALALSNDQLDRLMIRVKITKPDFYAAYLNARKVVDYGIRHEKPEVIDPAVKL